MLYQIILQKAIINEYNYYHNDGLKQWINSKDFIDAYPQRLIERCDFEFIYLINGRHIKYDHTNPSINSMIVYSKVSLKLNVNKNLRELMEHYLDNDDLKRGRGFAPTPQLRPHSPIIYGSLILKIR